jgi:1,4-alpha-glucan branching enzyme
MGWMHDTLKYFQTDPLFRAGNHNKLTFGLVYAWSENFILPFSHDEVVHMKGSLLNKMPGTTEQKFATLRALYAYMWAHPGKKLLFMGGELGQWREWNETESLDWHLLENSLHGGVQKLIRDLNQLYGPENALWEADGDPAGFEWIDVDNALENIVSFLRRSPETGREIICVCNFSAVPKKGYKVDQLSSGDYDLILNTDADIYGGNNSVSVNNGELDLAPLTTLWFAARKTSTRKGTKSTKKKTRTTRAKK